MGRKRELCRDTESMWDIERDPLFLSIGGVAGDFSLTLSKEIEGLPFYERVKAILPSNKLISYVQRAIAVEIYPFVSQMMIMRRQSQRNGMWIPSSGIFSLLRDIWPTDEVPLVENLSQKMFHQLSAVNRSARRIGKNALEDCRRIAGERLFDSCGDSDARIAVRYVEGLDLKRRSDFFWFPESGIEPRRVLVYFDGPDNVSGQPISGDVLEAVEKLGMKWTCLKDGALARANVLSWRPRQSSTRSKEKLMPKPRSTIEKWLFKKMLELLREVEYWSAFYKDYCIKLLLLPEQSELRSIAQGIAFDVMGSKAGFTIGKQRSDMGAPVKTYVGHHTKDIQFVWNERIMDYLRPEYNRVRTLIIAGYTYDAAINKYDRDLENSKTRLLDNGVRFVTALFDNGHGGIYFSSSDVESFYRAFLEWVMEDPSVGIVIKSKKPHIIKLLPNLSPLFAEAEATGRCIRLNNEVGRLPSDASKIADMAVGVAISTAVTEAVIAGCRGIHYLKCFPRNQDYFKWGLGQLVFDDLDRMINALKRYKANPNTNPQLGDWAPFLDKLDPFRDGRAGERVGKYLRWCLDGFDSGLDRDEVLSQANDKYALEWGRDKVITF